ncbi:hypothetical protein [Actinoallomurus sp. CA-150999]|uniref:VMAP-C domain-containing protein n=1 Tax=Actinoallomurus sp. CA-150999 TaxID=3239887 RepID=UPI003D8C2961
MAVLEIEPVVRWPRRMTPGLAYLVEVDLVLAGEGAWPYDDEEELAFTIMLAGGPWVTVEALGDSALILHRFGGTYGPVRFVAVADEAAGPRSMWLNLLTERGVIARTDELPTVVGRSERGRAEETTVLSDVTRRVLSRTLRSGVRHFAMVEVEPAGVVEDTYRTTVWSQVEGDDYPVTLLADDHGWRLDEIPTVVGPVLRDLDSRIAGNSEMSVEFILPRRLLGLAVDEWRLGDHGFGRLWPVVVRDRERIRSRDSELRDRWRERWRHLQVPRLDPEYLLQVPRSGLNPQIAENASFAFFDPRSSVPDDATLGMMVNAGVPAMLWGRGGAEPAMAAPIRQLESVITRREIGRLPQYVHRLRREIKAPLVDPVPLGLLWDDPDRLPEPFAPLAFPR